VGVGEGSDLTGSLAGSQQEAEALAREAVEVASRVVLSSPGRASSTVLLAQAHLALGDVLASLSRPEEAKTAFEQALASGSAMLVYAGIEK